jgi:hypothetical protein
MEELKHKDIRGCRGCKAHRRRMGKYHVFGLFMSYEQHLQTRRREESGIEKR